MPQPIARRRKPESVPTTCYFPTRMHRALKIEAAGRGMTMSEVLIEAFETRVLREAPTDVEAPVTLPTST